MGFLRRQEQASERTPEQRAHARAVREARRKGLPEPPAPAPAPAPETEAEAEDALPPEVEPAAARLPEPESEPEPEAKAAPEPEPEPEPEPAPVGAPLTWDVTEEWEAVGEHDRPHGDPLAPETP